MFSSWGRGDSPAQQGTNVDWLLSGGGGLPPLPTSTPAYTHAAQPPPALGAGSLDPGNCA